MEYDKIRTKLEKLPIKDCKPKWINEVYGH